MPDSRPPRPPRWAIICGLIRNEDGFRHQLETMLRYKEMGEIDDIVVSTWFGEFERYPAVWEAHARGEFILVQSEPPLLKVDGYTIHQAKCLHNALQAVPDGALCLKIRPDLGLVTEAVMDSVLTVDLTLTPQEGWPEIFQQKILTAGYVGCSPFYINDILFYGQREDLLRLASFDLSTEMVCANTGPEQFFFRGAFARVCPLIEAYLKVYPPFLYGEQAAGEARVDTLLASDFFLDVLATSTRFMRHYFRVGFIHEAARKAHAPLPKGFDLREVLVPKAGTLGVNFNSHATASSIVEERVISAILEGRFKRDALGKRMMAALKRTEDPAYWREFRDNNIRPAPGVRDLQQALKSALEGVAHPYGDRLAVQDDEHGRKFTIAGPQDRVLVTTKSDEVRRLEEEINIMRRQMDAWVLKDRQRNQERARSE